MTDPEEYKESSNPHGEDESVDAEETPSDPDLADGLGSFEGLDSEPLVHETPAESRNLEEREVHVMGVYEQTDSSSPVGNPFVLLRDNKGRCVMIWIGRFEALAISTGLEKVAPERPLTHDLLRNVTDKLGGKIDRIVIDDLWGETFYAKLWIQMNGKTLPVDSRPSDAIAIAVRSQCTIYMTEAVLEEAGRPVEDFEQQ